MEKMILVMGSMLVWGTSVFAAPPAMQLMPIPVSHVYAPMGFDTNDNTEVLVSGYLPSLCYKAPRAIPTVSGKSIRIQVAALRDVKMTLCAQMAVPVLESAQVGVLDQGQYQIVANPTTSSSKSAAIQIVQATSPATDDYVYANVQSVERIPGTRTVQFTGVNPSDCYAFQEIKAISNGVDTYSVLPILTKVSDTCAPKPVPFTYEWQVPTGLNEKTPLLHVRVMNGKSVNYLFNENE